MSEPGILPNPIPFGKYYLLERINVGGMAEVYKAKAFGVEGFERLLAVKKILSSIAEDEAFINMFIDEAKIAGQLNHPNIAQIFDLGKVEDSYFIALEYIGGKDLKTIFERARRLGEKVSIPRVCYIIMKVCEGLSHAHHKKDAQGRDLNIVHRDVSPQNVLLSYEGEVKIIDFGIAKAQGKTSQTQVGILKGKFSYMSPEQVRGLHVDNRSDIFSLGIVLYELLTLERLFLGESDFDTLEKIRKVEMSPPSLYNPHIPKELEDIVLKALAKSPDDRFQTASEFAEAIERFMRNQGYYFTNKDLGGYMKEAFNADIEFENKKIEYYRSLNLQPLDGPVSHALEPIEAESPGGGLEWGEEEMETQIFDRPEPEELDEADIVYAGDVEESSSTDEIPTVEYDRWKNEGFSFENESPQPRSARSKQPTAQLEPVDRGPARTTGPVQLPQKKKKRSVGGSIFRIVAIFVVLFGIGLVVMNDVLSKAPLLVETDPKSVEVWINGERVHDGDTPFRYELPAGPTTIELKRDGFVTFKTTQDIDPDSEYRLNEELEPLHRDVEFLVKSDPPGANIQVAGDKLDEPTPYTVKDFPKDASKVELVISKEGYFDETRKIDLAEAPESLEVRLKPRAFALKVTSVPDRAEYTIYDAAADEKIAQGRTPDTVKDLDASKTYKVVMNRRKYERWEDTFEPSYDPEPSVEASLKREEPDDAIATVRPKPPREPKPRDPKPRDPKPRDPEPKDPEPKDPKPKARPSGTGVISVASKPAARVYINGQDTGRYTPLMNFKIKSGKHKISLKNPDFGLDKTYYVDVKPGESKRIINRP